MSYHMFRVAFGIAALTYGTSNHASRAAFQPHVGSSHRSTSGSALGGESADAMIASGGLEVAGGEVTLLTAVGAGVPLLTLAGI